jgi:prevent-host-death family protein
MKSWQLQDAKAHLSKVVKEAILHGPQEISLRGEPAVVVIAKNEYEKLAKPKPNFIQFMRNSPLVGIKINLSRNPSKVRKIDL